MKYLITFLISILSMMVNAKPALEIKIKTQSGWDAQGQYRLQHPVLTRSSYGSQQRKKFNALLKKSLMDNYHCAIDPPKMKEMYFFTQIEIAYLSSALLSLKLFYNSYCGGPHPNKGFSYFIFDLKTPRLVKFEESVLNKYKFSDFLYKQFLKQQPKNYLRPCRTVLNRQSKDEIYPMFLLEKGKITVRQDYPFVTKACEFDITITCHQMRSFLNPTSLISRYCAAF